MPASSDNLGFKSHTKNHAQIPRSSELFLLYGRHQRGAGWERCRLAGSQLGQDARARVNSRPPLMRPTGATGRSPSSQLFPFFCVSFGCTSCHFVIFFSEGVHTSHINTLTHQKLLVGLLHPANVLRVSLGNDEGASTPPIFSIIRDGKEKASAAKEKLLLLSTHTKTDGHGKRGNGLGALLLFLFEGGKTHPVISFPFLRSSTWCERDRRAGRRLVDGKESREHRRERRGERWVVL